MTDANPIVKGDGVMAASGAAAPARRKGVGRVLLVGDDPVHGARLQSMLAQWNMDVELAADGHDAVSRLGTPDRPLPDLVLMEARMPGLDGVAAIRLVRALPLPACDAPIVALSASASAEDRAALRAAGADGCLSKPVDAAELAQLLESGIAASNMPRRSTLRASKRANRLRRDQAAALAALLRSLD
ncbi:MAG: response regulator [Alphaproteobacteria bacterium]|nr:MAG: response regulator [Alphaproteobacteria bacterium]